MGECSVLLARWGPHPSLLDFSLSSAATWTSSLLEAVCDKHFKILTVSREVRPRKLTFYCLGSLWEMMRPQCPGPPTVPLSEVSSVSTCSLSVSLRKPATRPLSSRVPLLTTFSLDSKEVQAPDHLHTPWHWLLPTWGSRQRHSYLSLLFDWVPCGAHLPSGNSSLSHLLSLCSVCFLPLFCCSVWFAALSSPTTDWIPAPGSESVASWPLNHQGIPCFLFSQSTPLSLLTSSITDFCENLFGIAKFSQKFSGALFYLGLKPCFLCMT